MNPFVVTTEGDIGYLAQNSVAGSRLNTNLGDLAVPTTAFTAEFLNDVAVTNVDDLAKYMVSTKTDYPEGDNLFLADDSARFRIRGLPAFNYSVNFFETNLRLDRYNTERIEQSRGPNSILFGLGSPGGVVNVATKKAVQNKMFGSVRLQADDNEGIRAELDYNIPLRSDKLALRVDAVSDHGKTWRTREFDNQDRIYLTSAWRITNKTRLDAEWEHGIVHKSLLQPMVASDAYTNWVAAGSHLNNAPNTAQQVKRISTTNWTSFDTTTGNVWNWINKTTTVTNTVGGVQAWLTDFSVLPKNVVVNGGSMFPQDTNYWRGSVFVTHAFTPDLNIELAANSQKSDHEAVTGRSGGLLQVDTNTTLPNGQPNPNAGRTFVEHFPGTADNYDQSRNIRLSGAYTRDLGKWGSHQFAALYQHDWIERQAWQRRPAITTNPYNTTNPQNGQNSFRFRTYFDLNGPAEAIGAGDWRKFFGGAWRDVPVNNIVDSTTGRVMGVSWIYNAVPQDNHFERDSAMAILQSHWLNRRLVTVAGYRVDWQDSKYSITDANLARGPAVAPFTDGDYLAKPSGVVVSNKAENFTYSALGRITKQIAITYNHARNSALPDPNAFMVNPDGSGHPPSPLGTSQDIGLKFTLTNKTSLNVLYYETTAKKDTANSNAQIENRFPFIWDALDAAGVPGPDGGAAGDVPNKFNRYTFDSSAKGYELELIANPTEGWRIFLNYSDGYVKRTNIGLEARAYVDKYRDFWVQGTNGRVLIDGSGGLAPVADDGDATVETVAEQLKSIDEEIHDLYIVPDGERGRGQVKRSLNLVTNYTFQTGVAKGFSIGGGVNYRDGEVVAYNATTDSSGNIVTDVIYGRKNTIYNLSAGYRNRATWLGRNIRWSVQLNVNNVLDEDQILPTRVVNDIITTYRVQEPRSWILSTQFDF